MEQRTENRELRTEQEQVIKAVQQKTSRVATTAGIQL